MCVTDMAGVCRQCKSQESTSTYGCCLLVCQLTSHGLHFILRRHRTLDSVQCCSRCLEAPPTGQPARTLRHEEETNELDNRWHCGQSKHVPGEEHTCILALHLPANKEPFLNQLACVILVHNWYCSTSTCFHMNTHVLPVVTSFE